MTEKAVRRHVTVLFSDLCNSSKLAPQLEVEEFAEITDKVANAAGQIVPEHGGVICQFQGDGVLAVFGYPEPQEDDVQRAVAASLELHELIRNTDLDGFSVPTWFLPMMHTGIHSGVALIQEGDLTQGVLKVRGAAVNDAAALSKLAREDEILTTARTLDGVRSFYNTERVGPLQLKDEQEPVPAYRITGKSGISSRFEARVRQGLTDFVGRESELKKLQVAFEKDCRQKNSLNVISVVGAAGLGKTRLIEEFLQSAEGQEISVHRGFCASFGKLAPLQPFLQMLQHLFQIEHSMSSEESADRLNSRLSEIAPSLSKNAKDFIEVLSLERNAGTDNSTAPEQNVIPAAAELFVELARQGPQILFLDDWQWADNASRHLMTAIIRAADEVPLLIVASARELDPSDPIQGFKKIALTPLRKKDSKTIIQALMPGLRDPDTVSWIQEESGGNALFIEELCQSPIDRKNTLGVREPVGTGNVPHWLYGLIEARVNRLPAAQAELVRCAAIFGNVIPAWQLERVSGYELNETVISELSNKDIIHSANAPGVLRFKHGITRDVIYESVGLKQRKKIHRDIAAVLENAEGPAGPEEKLEELAYHYAGAGDFQKAAEYAVSAGDKATARSSLDRARQQYRAALDAISQLQQTDETKRKWMYVVNSWALPCCYSPDPAQLRVLEQALEYATDMDDGLSIALANYWIGYILYALGNQGDAIQHFEESRQIARRIDNSKLAIQVTATLGQSYAASCDYPRAIADLDEAVAVKSLNPSQSGPPVGSAYARACKALVLADKGDFKQAREIIDGALEMMGGVDHEIVASIRNIRSVIFLWQGNWDEVLEGAYQSQKTAEQMSMPYVFAMSQAVEGHVHSVLGRTAKGLDLMTRAIDYLEGRHIGLYISMPFAWLTEAAFRAELYDDMQKYANRAFQRARRNDGFGEAGACRVLARAAQENPAMLARNSNHYFEVAYASARARDSRHEEAVTRLEEARYAIAVGEESRAEVLLKNASAAFTEMEMHWHLELAQKLRQGHGV